MLYLICQFVKYHRIMGNMHICICKTIVMFIHVELILYGGQPKNMKTFAIVMLFKVILLINLVDII